MNLGNWQLDSISGGRFKLDGGAMFGVVPKPLWEKLQPADQRNRIRMATNCLLLRDGAHTVLVDTGTGNKHDERTREQIAVEPGDCLVDNLAAVGVAVDDVDTVILTHLHFDHAGGATRFDATGKIAPTFPRARYVVQRGEYGLAASGARELRGVYPTEHFQPLIEAGQLDLIDGPGEIVPGVRAILTPGHTQFHQSILIESGGQTACYVADLCPMAAHVRSHWCMAYDTEVLETRRQKPRFLGQAADAGWLVLWDHDPDMVACRLTRDAKREFAVVDPQASL